MAEHGGPISLSNPRPQSHTSDDEDSSDHSPRSVPTLSGSGSSISKHKKIAGSTDPTEHHQTGSKSEVSKKPRGRPAGSKNKPKPPIVITKYSDTGMKPVVLEISAGSDVVETLVQFARIRQVGISVLSGSGSVSDVTLRQTLSHAPSLSLHGPFSLLSLSGSYISSPTPNTTPSSSSNPAACSSFGICLAGAQGQVFGGIVGGKVIAAGLVVVVAATFMNPPFHKLPSEIDEAQESKQNVSEGMPVNVYNVSSPTPLSFQIPTSEVMPWGPTSRSSY